MTDLIVVALSIVAVAVVIYSWIRWTDYVVNEVEGDE